MDYRIEFAEQAEAELVAAFLFLSGRSPEAAVRWLRGLQAAIASLVALPRRCPVAPEDSHYPNNEIRQLVYGRGRGAYRILYTIFDEENEVRILHIRHGAQQRSGQ